MDETTTINISMPESLREYVKQRMAARGFGNVSEYFRDLVRQDQKREAEEKLETLLLEGLESGGAIPLDKDWLARKKAKLAANLKKAKPA